MQKCQRAVCKEREATMARVMAELRAKVAELQSDRSHRSLERSIRAEYDEAIRARDDELASWRRHGYSFPAVQGRAKAQQAEAEAKAEAECAIAAEKAAAAAAAKASRRAATLEERLRHATEVRVAPPSPTPTPSALALASGTLFQ